MAFLYSAIGDNTIENREHLEKLGYKLKSYENDDTLIWAQPKGTAYTEKQIPDDDKMVNCIGNPQLFKAVTAMRDDSDMHQLFFIEWLRHKDDVFYAFYNTEDVIDEFINSKTYNDEETI